MRFMMRVKSRRALMRRSSGFLKRSHQLGLSAGSSTVLFTRRSCESRDQQQHKQSTCKCKSTRFSIVCTVVRVPSLLDRSGDSCSVSSGFPSRQSA